MGLREGLQIKGLREGVQLMGLTGYTIHSAEMEGYNKGQ